MPGTKGYRAVKKLRIRSKDKRGGGDKWDDGLDREPSSLAAKVDEYLTWLRMHNRTERGVKGKAAALRPFLLWTQERDLIRPDQVTRSILESYQRWLWRYRKKNGQPLGISTQLTRLGAVKTLFGWLCKQRELEANPASELELPRGEKRLPIEPLSIKQMKAVLAQPDVMDPLGIRDRAMLELFYSTGIRRSECVNLEISDLNFDRKLLRVRQGKGRKDRMVPVGVRALEAVGRYLEDVRPLLHLHLDEQHIFLTGYGEPFSPDVLSRSVSQYIKRADIGRTGSCHLLRHTCANHMLEGGADIRYIQQLLGHENLETTARYTEVSIIQLQAVHAKTHPSA